MSVLGLFSLSTAVNQAPSALVLSNNAVLLNGQATDYTVGTLTTTDADADDAFIYTLEEQTITENGTITEVGYFSISDDVLLCNARTNANTYVVKIRSTDTGQAYVEQSFNITTTSAGLAPTWLQLNNYDETTTRTFKREAGRVIPYSVGVLTSGDYDTGIAPTYSLESIVNSSNVSAASYFTLTINSITCAANTPPDTYTLTIKATGSNTLYVTKTFTVVIQSALEAPDDYTVVVNGNTATATFTLPYKKGLSGSSIAWQYTLVDPENWTTAETEIEE